jgi:uncharacterized protein YukE
MTSPTDLILCNTPLVADAVNAIQQVYTLTDQNHQRSLGIVANNAENLGGTTSDAFQQNIGMVNAHYQSHKEVLLAAANALGQANDGFTQADQTAASQYNGGGFVGARAV